MTQGGCRVSPETQERIDVAIRSLVMEIFERTYALLQSNRSVLERCARELLAKETLDEDAIRALTADLRRPTMQAPGRAA
jgi:cell division protease FtsH